MEGGPGTLVLAPRGVPHTYWNPGASPALYLEICWPGGLERYVEELDRIIPNSGRDLLDEVGRISATFGIEMDGSSTERLLSLHGLQLLS